MNANSFGSFTIEATKNISRDINIRILLVQNLRGSCFQNIDKVNSNLGLMKIVILPFINATMQNIFQSIEMFVFTKC